jgi:protein involved in polysaccharide export with SLBB domain/GT2 family glycosyltransferase
MNIDIVIIGLNCAATLRECVQSALNSNYDRGRLQVCYVDSGSTDESVRIAREFGDVIVLELVAAYPSPGATRNLGFRHGSAPFVQFLDSDTIMDPDWLNYAVAKFQDGVGAVRGWRRERFPTKSVFNWIADQEWNSPAGDCDTIGGDALVLREALEAVGGYDEELVGGEDPELSERIRQAGWKVRQLDHMMTMHDLAMFRISQYWKRAYRTGYGYAAVADQHGDHGFWIRELIRIAIRGGVAPGIGGLGLLCMFSSWVLGLGMVAMGGALIFQPFLLRQGRMRRAMGLSVTEAMLYSLHCSLVVIPEFAGMVRYWIGELAGTPLRNTARPKPAMNPVLVQVLCLICVCLVSFSCHSIQPGVHDFSTPDAKSQSETFNVGGAFEGKVADEAVKFATENEIASFSNSVPEDYLIGPGDVLGIIVRGRPDVSMTEVTVSPDGKISMPLVGILDVSEQTVEWLTTTIREGLKEFYSEPDVVVVIREYHNNKVFVLGRVDNPGLVSFKGNGTLLEAIFVAGGMSTVAQNSFLSKAIIFRGKDMVIWVDLKELLNNGNMALNARLKNNDLVFIPESHDDLVYVMGEVRTPGALKLTSELSLLDALMMSGAPTIDGKLAKVYLIRYEGKKGMVQEINLKDMIGKSDLRQDYVLRDGDIVYVSSKVLRNVNYVISSLSPSLSYLDLARSATLAGGN